MARIRDQDEIRRAFANQLEALADSCAAFDAGKRWEAIRLATTVYTLVHDGGKKYRSMLTTLGRKTGMKFLSSASESNANNPIFSHHLIAARVGPTGAHFVPKFDNYPSHLHWVRFGEWWEREPVFSGPKNRNVLVRKKLVFGLRSREGGGHFEEVVLDPNYVDMTYGATFTAKLPGQPPFDLRESDLVSMRQVAWELQQSVQEAGLAV